MTDDKTYRAKEIAAAFKTLKEKSVAYQLHLQVIHRAKDAAFAQALAIQHGERPMGEAPLTESEFIARKAMAEGMGLGIQKVLDDLEELENLLENGTFPPFVKVRAQRGG